MNSISTLAPYLIPLLVSFVPNNSPTSTTANRYLLEGKAAPATEPLKEHLPTDAIGTVAQVSAVGTVDDQLKPLSHAPRAASWMEAAVDRVWSYRSVVDGWKGIGSIAPSPEAIVDATDLLEQFAMEAPDLPRPMISADEDGTVCLFWRDGIMMATISVYGDGTYSFYAEGFAAPARSDSEPVGQPLPQALVSAMVNPDVMTAPRV